MLLIGTTSPEMGRLSPKTGPRSAPNRRGCPKTPPDRPKIAEDGLDRCDFVDDVLKVGPRSAHENAKARPAIAEAGTGPAQNQPKIGPRSAQDYRR